MLTFYCRIFYKNRVRDFWLLLHYYLRHPAHPGNQPARYIHSRSGNIVRGRGEMIILDDSGGENGT